MYVCMHVYHMKSIISLFGSYYFIKQHKRECDYYLKTMIKYYKQPKTSNLMDGRANKARRTQDTFSIHYRKSTSTMAIFIWPYAGIRLHDVRRILVQPIEHRVHLRMTSEPLWPHESKISFLPSLTKFGNFLSWDPNERNVLLCTQP